MPDPLQGVKGCEDYNEMVPTSHVTAENILQDGSKVIKLVFHFFVVLWRQFDIYLNFVVLSFLCKFVIVYVCVSYTSELNRFF